jgi:hypothetical protein
MEQKVIEQFTSNAENTMNAVLSSSVGMVLLNLSTTYLTEASEHEILKEIKEKLPAIALHETKDREKSKTTLVNFQAALESIENKINESVSQLDMVTLYNIGQYQIPLKEVLILVWRALTDDKKFTHHYAGNESEKLVLAQENQADRLLTFFHCLQELHLKPVCHQGTRHELVFLLNKIYPGVDIIEDATLTIISYLKQTIFNRFNEAYTVGNQAKRKRLMSALIVWMQHCNVNALLEEIDLSLRNDLFKALTKLFSDHGSDPKLVIQLIEERLDYLEFSCNSLVYPVFAKMHYLLNEEESGQCALRSKALTCVKDRIVQIRIDNLEDYVTVLYFHQTYQIHKEITRYEPLIRLSGIDINQFKSSCKEYFQAFIAGEKFPAALADLLVQTGYYNQILEELKKDNLALLIENFFVNWFITNEDEDRTRQKDLYKTILLDESAKKKIILSDADLKQLMSSKNEAGEKEIQPYEINRIFLHAILKKPEEWSLIFYQTYAEVLKFVMLNFNQNSKLAVSLKNDSYPIELMMQLDYLKKRYQALTEKENDQNIERPCTHMILLPEDIQTADEWITLSKILSSDGDEGLLNQIYFRNKVHIQSVLSRSECDLRKKIRSIPKLYYPDLIKSGEFSLPDILSAIPKGEDRYQFMQSLGKKRYEPIQTFDDLFNIVSALPYDYRSEFILGLGEKKYEIIKKNDEVKSIIKHLLCEDAEAFIEDYEKYRDNVRKNSLDCPPMLSSTKLRSFKTIPHQNYIPFPFTHHSQEAGRTARKSRNGGIISFQLRVATASSQEPSLEYSISRPSRALSDFFAPRESENNGNPETKLICESNLDDPQRSV